MLEDNSGKKSKLPQGALILGSINIIFFGILFLGYFSLYFYLRTNPEFLYKITEIVKIKEIKTQFTYQTLQASIIFQLIVCSLYITGGVGVLKKKEWGRKLTVYFSLTIVVILFLFTLLQPSLVQYTLIKAIYPGVLIWYFTNKKIIDKFS